jgi:HPt (histidine-containing phosphotransfer) domain-containing protein
MGQAGQPDLAVAMNRLWTQFLPQLEARVAVLQAAGDALGRGTLAIAEREQAGSAAHKLAGVLGTFGLAEGTALAREAEALYSGLQADPAAVARLKEIPVQLRAMIAGRK